MICRIALFLCCFAAALAGRAQPPKIHSGEGLTVSLPAGTVVPLRLKRVKKEQLELNETLRFEVREPVVSHSAVLIRAGAAADCRLKKIEPIPNGCELVLVPETVEAADGRAVLLKSAPVRCTILFERFDNPVDLNAVVYRDITVRSTEIRKETPEH